TPSRANGYASAARWATRSHPAASMYTLPAREPMHAASGRRPRMHRLQILVAVLLAATLTAPAAAQQAELQPLRVFLTCNTRCDRDFLRTELDYLEWMRDRADADVHVLINDIETGGGGEQYELWFIGLDTFAGRTDT